MVIFERWIEKDMEEEDVLSRATYYPGLVWKVCKNTKTFHRYNQALRPGLDLLAEQYSEAWALEPVWSLSVPRSEPLT
jgi:hypothetical protein